MEKSNESVTGKKEKPKKKKNPENVNLSADTSILPVKIKTNDTENTEPILFNGSINAVPSAP